MTDITERLRDPSAATCWGTADNMMREAADEIERLRAALNFIATHSDSDWPERCRLNVERARAALGE